MKSGGRSGHSTFVLGVNGLETIHVLWCGRALVDDIPGQWSLAKGIEFALELIVRTVVEETQRTTATGGIVDDLSHHRAVLLEEQLITDTNLAGGFYQHIPQAQLWVQFAQQEDLNLGIGLLLGAIKARREHLRIVKQHGVALAKVFDNVAELDKLVGEFTLVVSPIHVDGLALAVHYHHTTFIATIHFLNGTVFILKHLVRGLQSN
jgi:hypothetical protein